MVYTTQTPSGIQQSQYSKVYMCYSSYKIHMLYQLLIRTRLMLGLSGSRGFPRLAVDFLPFFVAAMFWNSPEC